MYVRGHSKNMCKNIFTFEMILGKNCFCQKCFSIRKKLVSKIYLSQVKLTHDSSCMNLKNKLKDQGSWKLTRLYLGGLLENKTRGGGMG